MHIPVHNRDGNPHVLLRKDELLAQRARLVRREVDHAQPGPERRRIDVPVKVGLLGVRLGELLHLVVGFLVELQGEPEGLGDGLVGDVVVSVRSLRDICEMGEGTADWGEGVFLTLGRCLRCGLSLWRLVRNENVAGLVMLSSPGDDKVVAAAHAAHSFHDFTLIVFDDFDPLQALYQGRGRQDIRASYHQGDPVEDWKLTIPREKHHFAMYAEFVCEGVNSGLLSIICPSKD